ncbi:hypothetical protein K493DRAFT_301996 [Basidiobolus meristosporus CBS 931.73]|uniref:Uncharacterized protein n=1 Tax=Basidiobolus meristosporus CBS 931.73 TaxID=1314790 RepID=A0A1Y1Y9M9_9FUNG|nr:hypothetical protein K493DRAFT_301996 [Basidiobolus meristosporus CBS 931.73]|eukprot:ORX94595.1 hypothetical protein K493DRAFT_301996 [Basidiobolus meristosporus CBS 931.73]
MCQEIKQRRCDIVKLNWDIAGLQAQIDFSFHHSTEALVAQMVEKFARIRASNEQGASSNPGVLASDSIGGDTTSSLEPTTSQETRAESQPKSGRNEYKAATRRILNELAAISQRHKREGKGSAETENILQHSAMSYCPLKNHQAFGVQC